MMQETGLSWREMEEWTQRQFLLFSGLMVEDIKAKDRARRGVKTLGEYRRQANA